jgi:hypothetical protein
VLQHQSFPKKFELICNPKKLYIFFCYLTQTMNTRMETNAMNIWVAIVLLYSNWGQ